MEFAMQYVDIVLGSALLLLGVVLILTAIIRSLRREWGLGSLEIWALPVAGVFLIVLGRWLVQ
jgi:hypothetical protein